MTNVIKILFFGDLVGKCGRNAVITYLSDLKNKDNKPDFVIVNGENASHGFGLTEKNYNELLNAGVNCITSGNHIWDKKDIFGYIENADKLIRPLNYPEGTAGVGSRIFEVGDTKIGVINALGRVFMQPIDSPWTTVKQAVEKMKEVTPNIIVDFHAEATAEKLCFGRYLSEFGVSMFVGTHTHVQTADEKIINDMAYITDVGFCGTVNSIIGMEYETSIKRLTTLMPERYEVAEDYPVQINAVEVSIINGKATEIKRINFNVDSKEGLEANVDNSV
ncbi:MAG: TIGR00282 family metallophosphoesterase [Candidatus Gastranaerophilales bacterium]|nr:TIGR00282 family metallophosphoesterase [Candidatus Gastranaerophilales bacterium]